MLAVGFHPVGLALSMEVGQYGAHLGGVVCPALSGLVPREQVQERPGQAGDAIIHASSLKG